jgi:subtilisin family serine protease
MAIDRVLARLLAALTLVAGILPAAAQPQPQVEGIGTVKERVARSGRVSVIARLAAPASAAAASAMSKRLAGTLRSKGVQGLRQIGSLPFVALEVDAAQLAALERSGAVLAVSENRRLRKLGSGGLVLIGAPATWARGARGAGTAIVIVDDGVQSGHPYLKGRVVRSVCSAPDCGSKVVDRAGAGEPCQVDCGHGTHVAGIAAGRGKSFSGVAPDASVISLRVFGPDADWEHLIRGLDYVATVLAPRYRIAAVNMSLGDETQQSGACDRKDAVYQAAATAIQRLRRLGIASVVASGNDGYNRGISAPACIASAIAVGSVTDADRVSPFSNSGAYLDLLAPGENVNSSVPGGGYARFSGTSMAAPHVAGALALIRSRLPKATVDQMEQALEATGKLVRDGDSGITRPRVDIAKALTRLVAPSSLPRVAAIP